MINVIKIKKVINLRVWSDVENTNDKIRNVEELANYSQSKIIGYIIVS